MTQVTGTIEAVSNKFGKFSILVNDTWYGTKEEWAPSPRPNKGDAVTFDNAGGKFIKKLVIDSAGAPSSMGGGAAPKASGGRSFGKFPIDPLDGQRSIIRQNAVTNANSMMATGVAAGALKAKDITGDTLLAMARTIEAYTSGDLDAVAAEKLVEASFKAEDMVA